MSRALMPAVSVDIGEFVTFCLAFLEGEKGDIKSNSAKNGGQTIDDISPHILPPCS